MQKFSVKDLRRIETEIDSEVQYTKSSLNEDQRNNQVSKDAAVNFMLESIKAARIKFAKLIFAKYEIRETIAQFNASQGINERCLKLARLEMESDLLENALNVPVVRATTNYMTKATEYEPGVTKETQDAVRAEARGLKRQIQRLKDSCNGINANGKIEVSEELYGIFKEFSFID